jgi:hypothetical protein
MSQTATRTEAVPRTKVSFPSHADALRRLFEIALCEPHDRGTPPFRAYQCGECRSWHLSRSLER